MHLVHEIASERALGRERRLAAGTDIPSLRKSVNGLGKFLRILLFVLLAYGANVVITSQ